MLLGSANLDDVINQLDTQNRISAEDSRILGEVITFRVLVKKQRSALRIARTTQSRVVADRASRRQFIQGQLAQRKRLLAGVQAEVAQLQAQEAVRQAALRRQLEARLEQARVAAELSQRDLARLEDLFKTGATTASDLDRVRLNHERNRSVIDELTAQLATAQLGGRADAIAAAEAEAAAAAAAKERTDWAVAQKAQAAPRTALVYDTLFREGEYVTAGTPVVSLLPPEHLKVRFFVPEADFAGIKAGDRIRVTITGQPPLEARVNYLSPRPEYTPPILYNRDNRAKLVFLVEAVFDGQQARDLHPGQPVDVERISP